MTTSAEDHRDADDTQPVVTWDDMGTPFSPLFGDRYRHAGRTGAGGLKQARHVFLSGCGLCHDDGTPSDDAVWRDAAQWRILENGFGLGLNFLATWQLWRQDTHRPAHLRYDAIEGWPPTAGDVIRSATPFPELAPLAEELANGWERLLANGCLELRDEGSTEQIDGQITLRLHQGKVPEVFAQVNAGVNGIFLDGFSPSLNPAMWSAEVMQAAASLSSPGTRAATWSVARSVREALADAGFDVTIRKGLLPKRDTLTAIYPCNPDP